MGTLWGPQLETQWGTQLGRPSEFVSVTLSEPASETDWGAKKV
jgi:hypothetical protein